MAESPSSRIFCGSRSPQIATDIQRTFAGIARATAVLVVLGHAIVCGQESKNACPCPESIGASKGPPPLVAVRGQATQPDLIVCGYLEKRRNSGSITASEFGVFECRSDEPIVEFGALQHARVVARERSLLITELTNWPFGPGWKWVDVPFREFVIAAGSPPVVTQRIVLSPPKLTSAQVQAILHEYESLRQSKVSPEDAGRLGEIVGRLLLAALSGDEEATTAFRSMRNWLNALEPFNAEVTELYNAAADVYDAYSKSQGALRIQNK